MKKTAPIRDFLRKRLSYSQFLSTSRPPKDVTGAIPRWFAPDYIKTMNDYGINLADFKINEKDTGSADYQIAHLTQRIKHLTEHMGDHKKDFASRRGLLTMVARRRKLLDYLKSKSEERYQKTIKALDLRK